MKKFFNKVLFLALALIFCSNQSCVFASTLPNYNASKFVLHAGGVTPNGGLGSNSLEALNNSYQLGYRTIEIDFSWTEDNKLVCVHDWDTFYAPSFGKKSLTYYEFSNLGNLYGYTPMTLENLADWLITHNDVKIVTDIKTNCVEGAKYIAERYPLLKNNFVIQIYSKNDYDKINSLGFNDIILTVYQMSYNEKMNAADLADFAAEHKLFGLTFPNELADNNEWLATLLKINAPLYTHTLNGYDAQKYYLDKGIYGIYTDYGNAVN